MGGGKETAFIYFCSVGGEEMVTRNMHMIFTRRGGDVG